MMTSRMTTLAAVAAVATVALAVFAINRASAGNEAQNITAYMPSGHFVLLAGDYTISTSKERQVEQGVFRLDTRTGDTWALRVSIEADGSRLGRWVPIREADNSTPKAYNSAIPPQ